MEFIAKDFEGLLLNAYNVPIGTDLFKSFPILAKYDEFKVNVPGVKKEFLLRYIIFSFDKGSPLLGVNDVLERRAEAALLAGFEIKDRSFPPAVDNMLRSLNPRVNHMVIRYCLLLGDIEYSIMVAYEDSLLKELTRLYEYDPAKETNNEKKKEVIGNIDTLRKNIADLRSAFLARNVDYFLTRSLHEFGEASKFELSPEYYAEKLKGWDNVSRYYTQ